MGSISFYQKFDILYKKSIFDIKKYRILKSKGALQGDVFFSFYTFYIKNTPIFKMGFLISKNIS